MGGNPDQRIYKKMKILIPNLRRRADKCEMVLKSFTTQSYPIEDVHVVNAHDCKDYANLACLVDAMVCGGWSCAKKWDIEKLENKTLTGDHDIKQIPINPIAHLAFRWTYLDLLASIVAHNEPALILLDDMKLTYPSESYFVVTNALHNLGGELLCLDPMVESEDAELNIQKGYYAPTEEATYWTPEAAKRAIPMLLSNPYRVIGDRLRDVFPTDKMYSTFKQMAQTIKPKSELDSDIHINSESVFSYLIADNPKDTEHGCK